MIAAAGRAIGPEGETGHMTAVPSTVPGAPQAEISPAWQAALVGYRRELSARQLSPHTLRAYSSDLEDLAALGDRVGSRRARRAHLPAPARLRGRPRRPGPRALEHRPQARRRPRPLRLPDPLRRGDPEPGRAAAEPEDLLASPARPRPRPGPRPARADPGDDAAGGPRPGHARARLLVRAALLGAGRPRHRLDRLRLRDRPGQGQGRSRAHRPARRTRPEGHVVATSSGPARRWSTTPPRGRC